MYALINWRNAHGIQIFRTDNSFKVSNQRPIPGILTSCWCLEHVVRHSVTQFFEKKHYCQTYHTLFSTVYQQLCSYLRKYSPRRRHSCSNWEVHVIAILTILVLELNAFEFTIKWSEQVSGTAVGTRMTPIYLKLFMKKLDSKFVSEFHLTPTLSERYRDDVFRIGTHSEEKLLGLVYCYSPVHPSIHFTYPYFEINIKFMM